MITAFTALAALVFTAQSLTATRDQIAISVQGQFTERYTTAVDQIGTQGTDHLETRLGGIYALERLAQDSPRDQPTIVEVLSAFIRANAAAASDDHCPEDVSLDVQAALTVLSRRNPSNDDGARIDISKTCLDGARLDNVTAVGPVDAGRSADFAGTNLQGTQLDYADLAGVDLTDADLSTAFLVGANLTNARLRRTDVIDGHLTDASLASDDLTDADFSSADLEDADLSKAHVTGAAFIDANLTDADLSNAAGLDRTSFEGANLTGTKGLPRH